jgi:hypothetical protein
MDNLNHRETLKNCAFSNFRPITAAEVPYLNFKTDEEATEAMVTFTLMETVCLIIQAETGTYPNDEARFQISQQFAKHAPVVKDASVLIDRVLEGVPGSLTYKPAN